MFCFVLHPLKWYESWLKYMAQPARNWRAWGSRQDLFDWHPNTVLNGCGASEFNQSVRNVVAKWSGYADCAPQHDHLKWLNLNFDEDFVMNYQPRAGANRGVGAGAARPRAGTRAGALRRYGYAADLPAAFQLSVLGQFPYRDSSASHCNQPSIYRGMIQPACRLGSGIADRRASVRIMNFLITAAVLTAG